MPPSNRGGARKGAGRPPLPKAEKRSARLVLHLTPSEAKAIDAWAFGRPYGTTVSEAARAALLKVAGVRPGVAKGRK